MSPSLRHISLPDLFAILPPLKDAINPYYDDVAPDARAWIDSFTVFNDRKMAMLIESKNELLCAHVYPYAAAAEFRTTCDFVNLLFVLDEISDEQSGSDALGTAEKFVRALQEPTLDDGSQFARIAREFGSRFTSTAGPRNTRRFIEVFRTYAGCVVIEASLREKGIVLDLDSYTRLRRNNSAVLPCFALAEYILGIDVEDAVYEDEIFQEGYLAACDFVCWSNDLYSYDMEQARGLAGNNIITVLMKAHGWDVQSAANAVGTHCKYLVERYVSARERLPGSLGDDAARLLEALGSWMVGSVSWSFKTIRYFGPDHLEVFESGVVHLRDKDKESIRIHGGESDSSSDYD